MRAYKYEDPVRVSFPTFDFILILLLGLSEVHGPDCIGRASANREVFVGIPECPRNARFGKSIQLATLAEPRLRSFLQMSPHTSHLECG